MFAYISPRNQVITQELADALNELREVIEKHGLTLEFEAEMLNDMGSMLTIRTPSDSVCVSVQKPYSVDLDVDLFECFLRQLLIY